MRLLLLLSLAGPALGGSSFCWTYGEAATVGPVYGSSGDFALLIGRLSASAKAKNVEAARFAPFRDSLIRAFCQCQNMPADSGALCSESADVCCSSMASECEAYPDRAKEFVPTQEEREAPPKNIRCPDEPGTDATVDVVGSGAGAKIPALLLLSFATCLATRFL